MKNDFDENSLSSLLIAVNEVKTTEETLKIFRIIGNPKIELRDPFAYSAVLDYGMVCAAFQYYNSKKNEKNLLLDISNLSNKMWDKSYALVKETDYTQPLHSSIDLEKTLSELQMDSNLISEWPKFNAEFFNMCDFFNENIGSSDIISNTSTICKNQMDGNSLSNLTVDSFEINNSDLKDNSNNLVNEISLNTLKKTGNEIFGVKSVISQSSMSLSQNSVNTDEENFKFHSECYFLEELDYEPSDIGETEIKESDSKFCICNSIKKEENGNFFNCCPEHTASEISTFQEKNKEVDLTKTQAEIHTHGDFINFFQSNFDPLSDKNELHNYKRCFEFDDDDSESDSEHSFKRNSSRCKPVKDNKSLQQTLINSMVFKDCHLNSMNEVILYVSEQCKSGNINEAIDVANKYISISIESVQLEIFKQLFFSVINFIKSSVVPVEDARISKNLEEIMTIFHQIKLFNPDLCSLIISEFLNCECAIKTGKNFFSFVQKMKVPVNSNAVSSYVKIIKDSEMGFLELISFMEYVKCVCNLPCPRNLLSEALERFSKQEENTLLVGSFRLCKFLCSISSIEVDLNFLQNFIEFCIKNDWWTEIGNFFQAWYKDGNLIGCLNQSFLFNLEDAGLFYEKLAMELYRFGDVSMSLIGILGQMGVSMMLEAFSRKQFKSAFQVLYTLHKHNINYMDLQVCLYNAPSYLKNIPKFADIFVFPFTVAFAALEICLHLKRFKDAYCIFKSFSLNLPGNMEDTLKLKVRYQRFGYLLNLTQELLAKEPLKLGLQAFHDICLAAKEFSLVELEDFVKEIQVIYNKYLIHVINQRELRIALELFEYSCGRLKDLFIIKPQILRALLVTFAENDRMDESYNLFSLGCARKVYNIEQTGENSWCLTIMSSWTVFEVEFAIRTFIKNISQAWDAQHETPLNTLLSLKICFKKSEEDCLEIECLKKSSTIDSAKETTCKVLHSLDSNIKWVENPVCVELVPDTIYNFWMKTTPNFLRWKSSRKNSLEDSQPNAEFNIHSCDEDVGLKDSTESNSVQVSGQVSNRLTPECSVVDSSYQLITDHLHHQSPTLPKSSTPEATISAHHQSNTEQEQNISSFNELSPDTHSNKNTCVTPGGKLSEASGTNSTTVDRFENADQFIAGNNARKCIKTKILKSRFKYKNSVSKTLKLRNKSKNILSKKRRNKKYFSTPTFQETFHPEHEWKNENFRITTEDGGCRLVKVAEMKNATNIPETVFQKIVLFLQSKVLLKCKNLQPEQQREKVNHLANLFILNNVVTVLDKKTMKLLNEFAEGCI